LYLPSVIYTSLYNQYVM